MNNVVQFPSGPFSFAAPGREELELINKLERDTLANTPQIILPIVHNFEAGCYSRTLMLPAERYLTGALMRRTTQVLVIGDCLMNIHGKFERMVGCAVLSGSAGRKQVFIAIKNTYISMFFATEAKTVAEAEAEFTDQAAELNSRRAGGVNHVVGG